MYRNVDDLAVAVMDRDPMDEEQLGRLKMLYMTYFDALHNPPEYVIGVGAITYAEQQLMLAQVTE